MCKISEEYCVHNDKQLGSEVKSRRESKCSSTEHNTEQYTTLYILCAKFIK